MDANHLYTSNIEDAINHDPPFKHDTDVHIGTTLQLQCQGKIHEDVVIQRKHLAIRGLLGMINITLILDTRAYVVYLGEGAMKNIR